MLKFSIYNLNITVSSHNINIKGSYIVDSRESMLNILYMIKEYVEDYGNGMESPFDHRSISSMVREWVAHNNLYKLGYKKSNMCDVDLNYPQKWYVTVIYWFLNLVEL